MATTNQITYNDLPTNMTVHPIKGDLMLLTNENAVKRSITNLLFTSPFERFFAPDLGAGLKDHLFENINVDTEYVIKQKIIETITNYEKRANLVNVSVQALPDENAYIATIVFSVNKFLTTTTLEVVLQRVR